LTRIANVVDLSRRAVLGIELKHGQQLDRSDAELSEIVRRERRNADRSAGVSHAAYPF
jgi:hypothetical protein